MQHHVFLSYSHHDIALMRRVRDDLRDAGLTVWTDESLTPGTESWKTAIETALRSTGSLVAMLTPDAKQSVWVEREIDYAHACGVPIVPVLARGDEIESIPLQLINAQRIDIRLDYAGGMAALVAAVQKHVGAGGGAALGPSHRSVVPGLPAAGTLSTAGHHFPPSAAAERLNPWNFLDQMKLLWWLFVDPGKLAAYLAGGGEDSARRTASWVVSGLGWLIFLLPVLGYSLGTVQLTGKKPLALALAYVLFLVGWMGCGVLGSNDPRSGVVSLVVAFIVAFMIFVLVRGVSELEFIDPAELRGVLGVFLINIGIGVAAGIAFTLANGATGTLAGIVAAVVGFAVLMRVFPGSIGALAGLLMVVLAFVTAAVLLRGLRLGRTTAGHYLVTGILALNYAVLVWLYLLGGWQVLAGAA